MQVSVLPRLPVSVDTVTGGCDAFFVRAVQESVVRAGLSAPASLT